MITDLLSKLFISVYDLEILKPDIFITPFNSHYSKF